MALAERLLRRTRLNRPNWHIETARRPHVGATPVHELDIVELRAAAAFVASGAVSRVTLANVLLRAGLLWEADAIARDEGVEILVVESRPNGTIDLSVGQAPAREDVPGDDVLDESSLGVERRASQKAVLEPGG